MWGPPGQKMNDRPPKSQSPLAANAAIERRKAVKTPARQGTKATHWHSGRPTATTNRQAAKVNVGIRALITFITLRGSWTQPDFAQVWARSASWRGPREIRPWLVSRRWPSPPTGGSTIRLGDVATAVAVPGVAFRAARITRGCATSPREAHP